MDKPSIEIHCKGAVNLCLEELTQLQGELKELSEASFRKLKTSILKNGITFPLFVWQDDGSNFILDGTQRDRVLRKLATDGYDVPPLPCALITAKDKREACEKILLISSQYGKMTNESLYEFISKNELGFLELEEMLDFPQINLEEFKVGWLQEPDFEPASADEQGRLDKKNPIICPECGHEFIP
jgi:ParB family chromosome partitioning protein